MSVISELKSILQEAKFENIDDFNINIDQDKATGTVGDVNFVKLTRKSSKLPKELNIVLKTCRKNEVMSKNENVNSVFQNEIIMYSEVFPAFQEFQRQKGVVDVFNSFPKYFGSIDNKALILNNLNEDGYALNDYKKSLTKSHIYLVLKEYATYHSVSLAMQDQDPERYRKITENLAEVWDKMLESTQMWRTIKQCYLDSITALENRLEKSIMDRWKKLGENIEEVLFTRCGNHNGVKVLIHGDAWNNNFLFKMKANQDEPEKVCIIDWQMIGLKSPFIDISYFLYNSISPDDLKYIPDIINFYYNTLKESTKTLGSDLDKLYPYNQFLDDWRNISKFGLIFGTFGVRAFCSDGIDNIIEELEDTKDMVSAFLRNMRITERFKDSMEKIILNAAENNLI